MARWEVQLFGSLRIRRGDEVVTRFRTRATESVFAYLALHVGKDIPRARLISIAWPDADEESGRRNLRTALSDIRQKLGSDVVKADRVMVSLERDSVTVDTDRFLASRQPADCPGKLLEEFSDPWILPFSLDLDDAYAQAVIARMESCPLEEAEALAAECLRRDPGRLDVRAKLRELGLGVESGAAPSVASSFVGREREIAEILQLVRSHRLVTLTGLGGSGKTRLAGEIWIRHRPEAWFIPLADLNDGSQIAESTRHRLKLPPSTQRSAVEQVTYSLESSTGLLIFDNFEHVLAGRDVVTTLLDACPNLHILVTSQVPLDLEGEVEYPVGPLRLAGSDDEPFSDAVLLFEERARAVLPAFSITAGNLADVRELCQRLDGFPLAVEIAAAKSRVFSPGEMVVQLEDRFAFLTKSGARQNARHGSLRTALDWSFERLADAEQTLLTELTVFRGGFTLEAVTDVTSQPRPDTLVDSLLVHSWIERMEGSGAQRFRMLESIREFASEMLPPKRRDELAKAHAGYFMQIAHSCYSATFGPREPEMHRTVEDEGANLDSAWLWLRSHDPKGNLTLITYLNWYYVLRGLSHVAEARMREALANAEPASNEVYCHALHCMGDFLIYQGRFVEAEPWYRKSLRMATQIDSKLMLGVSQVELAWSLAEQGKFDDAEETIQRAIEVQTQHQGPNWIGSAYCIACLIANRRGDPETALERGAVSIRWCREGGYKWGLASVLNEMAFASRAVGDLNAALTYETESIEIKRGILSPRSLALSLESLARIYLDLGAIPEAKQSAQEAFRILRSLGDTTTLPSMHEVASRVCAKLGQAKLSEAFRVAMTPTPDLCPVGRQSDYSPPFDAAPNGRTVAPIVDAFLAL